MSSSAAWDLSFGIIAVLVMFVLASSARRPVAIGVLLALIPFQLIDTRYASSSVLMTYALAAVLILNGGFRFRMVPALGFILLAYLISLTQADRELLTMHAVAVFNIASCLVVFLLAYNYARLVESEGAVVNVLLTMNVLVVVYCFLQLLAGPGERFVPFGIESFAFNVNREPGDPRLVGPFRNPGSTAGFFTLMILVCAVELMSAQRRRRLFIRILACLNLLGLVATANRTGFLILLAMFLALLFTFRRELGARKIALYLLGGAGVLAATATVVIVFTDFDRMFSRMGTVTELEGGIPATRVAGWPAAFKKIKEEPWFGEGPFYWTAEDAEAQGQMRVEFEALDELGTVFDPYPHSLYLYLLRTVGIIGLVAMIGFFVWVWRILYRALRRDPHSAYRASIIKIGLLLIPAFLVAQVTLEFNRQETIDYAQFIFALMGLLVGASERGAEVEGSDRVHGAPAQAAILQPAGDKLAR